eukprot:g965.t1
MDFVENLYSTFFGPSSPKGKKSLQRKNSLGPRRPPTPPPKWPPSWTPLKLKWMAGWTSDPKSCIIPRKIMEFIHDDFFGLPVPHNYELSRDPDLKSALKRAKKFIAEAKKWEAYGKPSLAVDEYVKAVKNMCERIRWEPDLNKRKKRLTRALRYVDRALFLQKQREGYVAPDMKRKEWKAQMWDQRHKMWIDGFGPYPDVFDAVKMDWVPGTEETVQREGMLRTKHEEECWLAGRKPRYGADAWWMCKQAFIQKTIAEDRRRARLRAQRRIDGEVETERGYGNIVRKLTDQTGIAKGYIPVLVQRKGSTGDLHLRKEARKPEYVTKWEMANRGRELHADAMDELIDTFE